MSNENSIIKPSPAEHEGYLNSTQDPGMADFFRALGITPTDLTETQTCCASAVICSTSLATVSDTLNMVGSMLTQEQGQKVLTMTAESAHQGYHRARGHAEYYLNKALEEAMGADHAS